MTELELGKYLISSIDDDYICDGDDTLLSDIFFTLKHCSWGEEDIRQEEIEYFLECLKGSMNHSFDQKFEWLNNRYKNS